VCPPIATTPGAGNKQTNIEEKNEHENPYCEFPEPFAERRNGPGTRGISVIIALVAFAATAGMTTLASGLNSAFTKIGSILGEYIS